jgi:hypothetical protein
MAPRGEERAIARPGLAVFGPFTLMRRLFNDIEQLWGIGQAEPSEEQALVGFVSNAAATRSSCGPTCRACRRTTSAWRSPTTR